MFAVIVALAFLAGVVVGVCGLAAVSLCVVARRACVVARRAERHLHDSLPTDRLRGMPFDDRRPEERRRP